MASNIDWAKAYSHLRKSGYSRALVAEAAGVNPGVLSQIIKGTYPHTHEPRFSNGCAVLRALKDAVNEGALPAEVLQDIRTLPPSTGG